MDYEFAPLTLTEILQLLPSIEPEGCDLYSVASLLGLDEYRLVLGDREWTDARLKRYPLRTWYCTDQWVGLYLYAFDGEPTLLTFQQGRKCDVEASWVSADARQRLKSYVESRMRPEEEPEFAVIAEGELFGVDLKHMDAFPAARERAVRLKVQQHEETLARIRENFKAHGEKPSVVALVAEMEEKLAEAREELARVVA